jgi:hypothetical protein
MEARLILIIFLYVFVLAGSKSMTLESLSIAFADIKACIISDDTNALKSIINTHSELLKNSVTEINRIKFYFS